MNPLTIVRRTQNINAKEAELGISEEASWHANYKDSAYVFVGGLPYDLTEGDLLAVFAQYGEIVDVNLVREKSTGKSKGFAFVAYEDQRSTTLSVDNLNGAQIAGRTIRVDHVSNYKKKEEDDEETERLKREERGVCRAFQKGECKYGDSCRFSHDAQRAADTGWGPEEDRKSKAAANQFDKGVCRAFQKGECKYGDSCKFSHDEQRAANTGWGPEEERKSRAAHIKFDNDDKRSRGAPPSRPPAHKQFDNYDGKKTTDIIGHKRKEAGFGDRDIDDMPKRSDYGQDRDKQTTERRSSRYESESQKSRDRDSREEMKTRRRHDTKSPVRDIRDDRGRDRGKDRERQSLGTRDYSSQHRRERDDNDDRPHARRDEDYRKSGR